MFSFSPLFQREGKTFEFSSQRVEIKLTDVWFHVDNGQSDWNIYFLILIKHQHIKCSADTGLKLNVKRSIILNKVSALATVVESRDTLTKNKGFYFKNPELNNIVGHTVAAWPQTPLTAVVSSVSFCFCFS